MFCGVPKGGEGSVAPLLSSLTPSQGKPSGRSSCAPHTRFWQESHLEHRECVLTSHMAQSSAQLPLSVAEVLLEGAVLVVAFLQHFFFHLFLLCLIAFGFVSAHCVCTDFLFSSFIWLEFNYALGTEIPDSKYCLFAFSSIYTGTWDIFLGEHFFFF